MPPNLLFPTYKWAHHIIFCIWKFQESLASNNTDTHCQKAKQSGLWPGYCHYNAWWHHLTNSSHANSNLLIQPAVQISAPCTSGETRITVLSINRHLDCSHLHLVIFLDLSEHNQHRIHRQSNLLTSAVSMTMFHSWRSCSVEIAEANYSRPRGRGQC